MEKHIPSFTDISTWEVNIYQSTGGSRSKKIAIHPESQTQYFFKGSKELESGEIRYPTEFWSEIVSSKIGKYLGFDMLDYNIAFREDDNQKIGCISKSMLSEHDSRLAEGKSFLTGFNPRYNPETDKKHYTFQFIKETLISFNLESSIDNIIEIIIFDSIVGNSDRHQENWGLITQYEKTIDEINKYLENEGNIFIDKTLLKLRRFIVTSHSKSLARKRAGNQGDKNILMIESNLMNQEFSPIYDSGCCLAREKVDAKVEEMINNDMMLEAYVKKGKSEIHWKGNNKKINHFDLVKLTMEDYSDVVNPIIKRVQEKFKLSEIESIVNNIDSYLPKSLVHHKLSDSRKKMMIKILDLRINKLLELL